MKSRRTVEGTSGSLVMRLILRSSTWSRAGLATWASTRVTVLDEELRGWRLERPRDTVLPGSPLPPFVCNTMLGRVDSKLGDVELSGLPVRSPAPRVIGLDDFVAGVRERVLPVMGLFVSSRLLAAEMPDSWVITIDSGTVEQAVARGDRESAALLVRRYMERPLRGNETWAERIGLFRAGWEDPVGGARPPELGAGALGWLARTHNLAVPSNSRGLPIFPKEEAEERRII